MQFLLLPRMYEIGWIENPKIHLSIFARNYLEELKDLIRADGLARLLWSDFKKKTVLHHHSMQNRFLLSYCNRTCLIL